MAEIHLDTEEEFRALIEHSTDIVSVLDEGGTILYQSPSVRRVLGYEREAIRGDNAFEYVHPDDREEVMEAFTRMVQGERSTTERVEFRFRDDDGSWVWLEAVGSNQTHTALEGYVVNSREITERKARERALERKNERLDEFASIVSHERSLAAIERMRRLIDDLLVLARHGDSVLDPEPVDVADDGPGISNEAQNVFEAGYSTDEDGTGYGLRIVERVVEAHGWEVSVTDSADGGARFEVTGVESV